MTNHTAQTPPALDAAMTVGATLRQAREHLGLSLAEVAAVTRIPRQMLEHLERDRFAEYSAPVFVRGHLSNYARELRLDLHQLMRAYERQTGQRPAQAPAESVAVSPVVAAARPAVARARQAARRARPSAARQHPGVARLAESVRPRHMAGVFLILCALFAAFTLIHGNRATAQDQAHFPETSQDDWSLERDVKKTRWLLEQPPAQQD